MSIIMIVEEEKVDNVSINLSCDMRINPLWPHQQ